MNTQTQKEQIVGKLRKAITSDNCNIFTKDEAEILRKARIISNDPAFIGMWEDALEIAYDVHFDTIQPDPNAMRRSV